jgi:sterol 3beta-glucosyltransferase
VPFIVDQPFWAARVRTLGVGARSIPHQQLTTSRLAAAIHQAATEPGLRQCAQQLGIAIRGEDGLASAVRVIRQQLGSP